MQECSNLLNLQISITPLSLFCKSRKLYASELWTMKAVNKDLKVICCCSNWSNNSNNGMIYDQWNLLRTEYKKKLPTK